MYTVNIHEAKTHLSRLIERAVNGEPFVIAKSGRPLVKVVALSPTETTAQQRIGFLSGQVVVPDDFDSMGREHIENSFLGADAR